MGEGGHELTATLRPDDVASGAEATGPRPRSLREDLEMLPGEAARVGRFRILNRLGQGGMGVVYAAFDEILDRRVAVKLLQTPGLEDTRARRRMRREARALARLSHPNVVGVHEVGEHRGQIIVAMEYVRGQTLSDWLAADGEDRPRPWSEVLEVFLATGGGLAAAHEAGLVQPAASAHSSLRPFPQAGRARTQSRARAILLMVGDGGTAWEF